VRLFLLTTIAGALLISACYSQPVISPQRPLRCKPVDLTTQCPKGFSCSIVGVCAPQSCQRNEDCPAGLACTSRGCAPPPDAGGDGAIQIPDLPDAAVNPTDTDGATPDVSPLPTPDAATPLLDGGQG
jgi:hypothetical protein